MNNYVKYNRNEIRYLNTTKVWTIKPIEIKEQSVKKNQKYILHATGDCDLDGRKYIALPIDCDHNDLEIKKKYNLM